MRDTCVYGKRKRRREGEGTNEKEGKNWFLELALVGLAWADTSSKVMT